MTLSPNQYPSSTYPPTHHYSASDGSEVPLFAPTPVRDFYGQEDSHLAVPMYEVSNSFDSNSSRTVINRTPSPTPSEAEALKTRTRIGVIDWTKIDWKNPRNWVYLVIAVVVLTLVILFVVYRNNIIHWLEPAARWLKETPGGWLVPIAIMIIISFPPLFGHEIVAMLCGIVWPLGIAFLIVAAGTIIGELANLYVFRYFFSKKSKKYETNITYACLVKVIQDGGFLVALLVRYSLIPPHLTTTIFAICGMSSLTFLASALLSLPKQLIGVYLGYSLENSADGKTTKSERIINGVVITVGIIVGYVAVHYINNRINEVKPQIIYQRRKARQQQHKSTSVESRSPSRSSMTESV